MELGPRDRLSQAFVKEQEKGRTVEGPYGAVVHLDLRHLGEKTINAKLPFVRELCLKYENIDPVTELIPVRPVVHYMMGGVHTDLNGATPLEGLYAAGEAACVSINGANRLGSNSLPELLVFGARAGRAAADYAAEQQPRRAPPAGPGAGRRGAAAGAVPSEERRPGAHRRPPRGDAEDHGTSARAFTAPANRWPRAAGKLHELQERFRDIRLDDRGHLFNTELISALELSYMLDVAETMAQCALQRTESRGAHQRTRFSGARR